MLKLIAEDFIESDKVELVLPFYEELVEKTKKEIGCISYELYRDIKDPSHFIFIEEWRDVNALDAHVESEHFKRLVPQIDQYKIQDGRFTHMYKLKF